MNSNAWDPAWQQVYYTVDLLAVAAFVYVLWRLR